MTIQPIFNANVKKIYCKFFFSLGLLLDLKAKPRIHLIHSNELNLKYSELYFNSYLKEERKKKRKHLQFEQK